MRIIQIVPSISYGDAVSNNIFAIDRILKENNYKSYIYADGVDQRLKGKVKLFKNMPPIEPDDIVLYHKASAHAMTYIFASYNCTKVLVYHNVTPAEFFAPYSKEIADNCTLARTMLKNIHDKVDYCLTVSDYNKQELEEMGFKNITVIPILIAFDDYNKTPNKKIVEQYSDGRTNILFTGRIAPNKKYEDIIQAFYYYNNYVDPTARLILVGSCGLPTYEQRLRKYIEKLELQNVIFTGHIPFDEILAYYKVADVFLCMSEHEGFCVPLAEAMYFNVPIIAYNSSAIAGTLDGSGVLVHEKDYKTIAELINIVIEDSTYREEIILQQQRRLNELDHVVIAKTMIKYIKAIIDK